MEEGGVEEMESKEWREWRVVWEVNEKLGGNECSM